MTTPDKESEKLTARAWGTLVILFLLQMTWSLDRSLPILLVESLRHAFQLTDSELGLVVGLAYGVAYGIGGLIMGPLLDQFNRVRMLAGMAFSWSALTALCGIVSTFPLLVAVRFGVGASESGGTPASYTIVSDVFPQNWRAKAIGIFKMGSPLGVVMASVVAGTIAVHHGWRAAFLVAGIPGVLLSIAVLFVIPGARKSDPAPDRAPYSLGEAIRFMARSPGVGWLMIAIIIFMMAQAGSAMFQMSLFQRVHGLTLEKMSWFLGAGQLLGCLGPLGAALIADRLARRDIRLTLHLLSAITIICMIVGLVTALANNVTVALGGMLAWQLISAAMSAPAFATLLTLTPPHMRGTTTGVLSAAMYLLGIGPAPLLTGLLSDAMGGGVMVRYAMAIMTLLNLAAVACFILSGRSLKGGDGPESAVSPGTRPATAA